MFNVVFMVTFFLLFVFCILYIAADIIGDMAKESLCISWSCIDLTIDM